MRLDRLFHSSLTSLLLRLSLLGRIALHPVQKLLPTFGVFDVFHSQVDSLFKVSTVDNLVTDDSDTSGGDVVDDSSFTVVV